MGIVPIIQQLTGSCWNKSNRGVKKPTVGFT